MDWEHRSSQSGCSSVTAAVQGGTKCSRCLLDYRAKDTGGAAISDTLSQQGQWVSWDYLQVSKVSHRAISNAKNSLLPSHSAFKATNLPGNLHYPNSTQVTTWATRPDWCLLWHHLSGSWEWPAAVPGVWRIHWTSHWPPKHSPWTQEQRKTGRKSTHSDTRQ